MSRSTPSRTRLTLVGHLADTPSTAQSVLTWTAVRQIVYRYMKQAKACNGEDLYQIRSSRRLDKIWSKTPCERSIATPGNACNKPDDAPSHSGKIYGMVVNTLHLDTATWSGKSSQAVRRVIHKQDTITGGVEKWSYRGLFSNFTETVQFHASGSMTKGNDIVVYSTPAHKVLRLTATHMMVVFQSNLVCPMLRVVRKVELVIPLQLRYARQSAAWKLILW